MRKLSSIIFIIAAFFSFSVDASDIYILNQVEEKNYSYNIEHLNDNNERVTVTSGFVLDEVLNLDSSGSNNKTNPFFITRSVGSKKQPQMVLVEIQPENFRNSSGIIQPFYPSVDIYRDCCNHSDSMCFMKNHIGQNRNGLRLGFVVPPKLHKCSSDIASFYLYYNPCLFEDRVLDCGLYSSKITVKIISYM